MKKILKITLVGVMIIGSYFLGTTQAKTEIISYIPDNYIALDQCVPLEDIAGCFIGAYDYPCFELKDVGNQLDDPGNRSYADIMESLDNENRDCSDFRVNMKNVVDYKATAEGIQLYFNDGTGYYWEK